MFRFIGIFSLKLCVLSREPTQRSGQKAIVLSPKPSVHQPLKYAAHSKQRQLPCRIFQSTLQFVLHASASSPHSSPNVPPSSLPALAFSPLQLLATQF